MGLDKRDAISERFQPLDYLFPYFTVISINSKKALRIITSFDKCIFPLIYKRKIKLSNLCLKYFSNKYCTYLWCNGSRLKFIGLNYHNLNFITHSADLRHVIYRVIYRETWVNMLGLLNRKCIGEKQSSFVISQGD